MLDRVWNKLAEKQNMDISEFRRTLKYYRLTSQDINMIIKQAKKDGKIDLIDMGKYGTRVVLKK